MHRLRAAAARMVAAAAWAARRARALYWQQTRAAALPILGPVLPFTPPPPPRRLGPWRPRIRPELRTIRERVIIYYLTADVHVAATLALAGWPVGDPL